MAAAVSRACTQWRWQRLGVSATVSRREHGGGVVSGGAGQWGLGHARCRQRSGFGFRRDMHESPAGW
ncbi:hypothetical protein OsI_32613 [Oryza sativa Indica Group]|uniref:Uncharacterized protein n=1 Tax=Oryza sativa subsp. indica TaxID=39946 RepID=A2Z4P0_ORYSI|nr:hypothetical protein OsI_32613 [Oryza sativa Indica Group]